MQGKDTKGSLKRWKILLAISLILVILGVVFWKFIYPSLGQKVNPKATDLVILANPTDLSKIDSISKFRSCFSHEFGYTSGFEGKEVKSSLKHYFIWKSEYQDKDNSVPIYAVFDGKIIIDDRANDQVLIENAPFTGWVITYTHVVLQPGLEVGSEVKAGQLVAYAQTHKTHAFDVALQANTKEMSDKHYDWADNYESIFNHMSNDVLNVFSLKGTTPVDMIISKDTRDQNACICDPSIPKVQDSQYCNFVPKDARNDSADVVILK